MKKIFIISLCILCIGCNGQNDDKLNRNTENHKAMEKTIGKLDLNYIKENAQKTPLQRQGAVSGELINEEKSNLIYYELDEAKNGKKIHVEGDEEMGFNVEIKDLNNDYLEYLTYDGKGSILTNTKQSIYGFLIEEKYYDNKKNLIKNINYDNEFKFKWEKVKIYLESLNVKTDVNSFKNFPYSNKDIPIPIIERGFIEDAYQPEQYPTRTKKIWYLEGIEGIYNNKKGIYSIVLDGDSGEELLIKQFKGKKSGSDGVGTYADYELIYSKLENRKQSSMYKNYEGKEYT